MSKSEIDVKQFMEQFVDYLLPELTPYESTMYLYLLRNSFLREGNNTIRTGKRTIAGEFAKGTRGERTSYAHVSKMLTSLEEKGCIKVGDTDRFGTLYTIILPKDTQLVVDKLASEIPISKDEDYFTTPDKRTEVFKRDQWICQYCGEKINQQNATLDHFIPQFKGGKHDKDNLRTACLTCNSIKSGKTYEEAAPLLLKSIQGRRSKSNKE